MIFTENHMVTWADVPIADINTTHSTDVFSMEKYNHICLIYFEGAGGTGTSTITVEKCTTAAGAGNTAIAFKYRLMTTTDTWGALTACASTGYATVAGANKAVAFEIDAAELGDGYPFVRLTLTDLVNSGVAGAVVAILSEPRFKTAVMPTSIA